MYKIIARVRKRLIVPQHHTTVTVGADGPTTNSSFPT